VGVGDGVGDGEGVDWGCAAAETVSIKNKKQIPEIS